MKVIPNVRLIPFSSSAHQYWEKNRLDALAKPQSQLKNSELICEQIPTAATHDSPSLPIMIVSTILAVVVNKFCNAIGNAIVNITYRKDFLFFIFHLSRL